MQFEITLRAARNNLGYTLKEASKKFGIHYEILANYEKDSTNIPRSFWMKLESVYGIPVEYFFFGKAEEFQMDLKNRLVEAEKQHA